MRELSTDNTAAADPVKWVSARDIQAVQRFVSAHISVCLAKDKPSLYRKLNQIAKAWGKPTSADQTDSVLALLAHMERSRNGFDSRAQAIPDIHYPDLPVVSRKDDILEALQNHQVVVIAGETGSGKTTQLPKLCLELGRGVGGLIAHTQPRRLAARSVATRIASELNTQLGELVGFKVRFSDQVSDKTAVKLMTDGMLLAELQQDRFLNEYDTIIIDEAHERSLNIDFLLGYLKRLLPKRKDLKIIITSATIDVERFSKHFNDAPVIEVSGRTYPVEIRYHEPDNERDLLDSIAHAVDELLHEPLGDILVFLSGEREIRDAQDALSKRHYANTEIIPLYARLSAQEQNRVFQTHSGRRIILATNVAETSLTVPGIKYVIDPGTARISRYSTRLKVQRLPIEPVSQASANQRAGRCGRVSDGICIRLYSQEDYEKRPQFTDPEILRTNLASVILQMMALGLGDIERFPFVQPPDGRNVRDGFRLLEELQATQINKTGIKLTKLGRQLARLPLDPRYARAVVAANETNAVKDVMIIVAGLSIQDPRERPVDKQQQADQQHAEFVDKQSDYLSLLNLWNAFSDAQQSLTNNQLRKWCKSHFVNYLRMREWQDIVSQTKQSLAQIDVRMSASEEASSESIHRAILSGLLSHLGMKDKDNQFQGARNSQFYLFPGSALAKKPPKWVMSAELVETSRLFGRINAQIDPEWVEPIAKHLCQHHYSEPHWSKKRGSVMAYERVTLYGLPIVAKRRTNYSTIDPDISQEIFVREALVNGDTKLNHKVLTDNLTLMASALAFEEKTRQRDWFVNEDELVTFYLHRLPKYVLSEASFIKWYKTADAKKIALKEDDVFKRSPTKHIENAYPKNWQQGRLTLPLSYVFEPTDDRDGVTVQIPLPVLNQLSEHGFDWHVAGYRHDKIVQLIKSLPKRLRRNFVPAPQYADACLADIKQVEDKTGRPVALLDALTQKLFRMSGIKIEPEDWQIDSLPRHLRMHFAVLDEKGNILDSSDDLPSLQNRLKGRVRDTFEQSVTPELERKGLTEWDIENLPDTFAQKHGGFEVKAFPALKVSGNKVDIVLLESEASAKVSHRKGTAMLLKLSMPSPLRYLQEKLPNKAKLALYFNPFGQVKALIDDCILAGIYALMDEFCQRHKEMIRTKVQFDACQQFVRGALNERVLAIAQKVEQGLTLANQLQKQLKGKVPLNLLQPMGHIKTHLDTLVFNDFVSDIGEARLDDWLRYLKALVTRCDKAKIDPNRDRMNQHALDKLAQDIDKQLNRLNDDDAALYADKLRWMIEELRVSLFAQQLGTAYPISVKRIHVFMDEQFG